MASILLLGILGFLILASVANWFAVEVVALIVLGLLLTGGLVTVDQAVAGFGNPAVLTVLLMMILSEGLAASGVVAAIGHRISRLAGGHAWRAVLLLLVSAGAISAFVNNTAVVAMFLPIGIQLAKQYRLAPSKLLLPLNNAAIFGGTCTLIGTSTNLVVDALVERHGMRPLGMWEFLPMGLVFLGIGTLYNLLLVRWLPSRADESSLTAKYQLTPYLTELRVAPESLLVGRTVVEDQLADRFGLTVLEIVRGTRKIATELRSTAIEPGDILIVRGAMEDIVLFKEQMRLLLLSDIKLKDADFTDQENILAEVLLSPASTLEGMTLKEIDFRKRFGAFVLALARAGERMREKLAAIPLQRYDTLLVFGSRRRVEELYQSVDFMPLQEVDLRLRLHPRWWLFLAVFVSVVAVESLFDVPLLAAALVGFALLLASRAIKIQSIYRTLNWGVFFLLAATLPIGTALETTGLATRLGDWLAGQGAAHGPTTALALLYLGTMILTELLSNTGTAVLMFPIAIATAAHLGVEARPFVMAVAFAASNGFMTPIGYQTNAMVYGAGGYRYSDFLLAGLPLNLAFWGLATWLIPRIWSF
ncbi:MAG: SLC13 family permease [Thermoanaerobaculia bacterium]